MGKEFYFALRAGGCCMYPQLDRPVRFSPDSADSVDTAVLLLEAAADVPVEVTRSPLTDLVSFVATTRGHPIALDVPASASAPKRALAFPAVHGRAPQSGNRSH